MSKKLEGRIFAIIFIALLLFSATLTGCANKGGQANVIVPTPIVDRTYTEDGKIKSEKIYSGQQQQQKSHPGWSIGMAVVKAASTAFGVYALAGAFSDVVVEVAKNSGNNTTITNTTTASGSDSTITSTPTTTITNTDTNTETIDDHTDNSGLIK